MTSNTSRCAVLTIGILSVCTVLGGCRCRDGKTWTETRVLYTLASEPCPAQLPTDTEALQVATSHTEVLDAEFTLVGELHVQPNLCWYELTWSASIASSPLVDTFRCPTRSTFAAARSHYARYASEVPRPDAPEFAGRGTVTYTPLDSYLVGCLEGARVLYRPASGGVCSAPDTERWNMFSTEIYHESAFIGEDPRPQLHACTYRVTYETSSGLEPDLRGMRSHL
jgi:hypothetical protein